MSDMTIERAREIVAAWHRPYMAGGPRDPIRPSWIQHMHAQGFLEGHASRDPEVAKLKQDAAALNKDAQKWFEKYKAEREARRKK